MKKGGLLLYILLLLLLAGCGGPKAEVPIFMMDKAGTSSAVTEKLQSALATKVGGAPTVAIQGSPIFSLEKMIVEIAAAGNGIIIIPSEQFLGLSKQGGFVPLDELAKPEDFPDGVLEITADGKTEKHLYGIPLENTKWFKEQKLSGKDLYAFIPANWPDIEKAKQVMKHIAQK